MSNSKVLNIIIIVLAVIGALAIISLLGMWIMHQTMMGVVTGGNGMASAATGFSSYHCSFLGR
jgi:hypothetical protein